MRWVALARGSQCPFCRGDNWERRSHLRWYDLIPLVAGMQPYRCLACWRRFYRFCWTKKQSTAAG